MLANGQNKNMHVPSTILSLNVIHACWKHEDVKCAIRNKKGDCNNINACSSCDDNEIIDPQRQSILGIHHGVEFYCNSQLQQSKNNLTHPDFKHFWVSLSSSSVLAEEKISNELTGYSCDSRQLMLDLEFSVETVLLVVSMCLLSNSSCVQRTYVGLWRPNKH